MPRVLVLGAGGRLGRLLAAAWGDGRAAGLAPVWQSRRALAGAARLDPLADPDGLTRLAAGAEALLVLAGTLPGRGGALSLNSELALAALAAAPPGAQVFLASSAAVYGPGGARDFHEDDPPAPAAPYGAAKAAMEAAAAAWCREAGARAPRLTVLRIGNVAGADALLGQGGPGKEAGPVTLDRFADGTGPVRSYIGPATLAAVLAGLARRAAAGRALPALLNIAAPGAVAMADLARAAGRDLLWRAAPEGAIARVVLDTTRLAGLVAPGPGSGDPARMVAEWRTLAPPENTP